MRLVSNAIPYRCDHGTWFHRRRVRFSVRWAQRDPDSDIVRATSLFGSNSVPMRYSPRKLSGLALVGVAPGHGEGHSVLGEREDELFLDVGDCRAVAVRRQLIRDVGGGPC